MTNILQNITVDRFLGGKLRIFQPSSGYRAGIDPVFLAASLPVKAGQRVLELGCGGRGLLMPDAARRWGECFGDRI